jgi:hypothetical protein
VPTNPDTVRFKTRSPSGTETTYLQSHAQVAHPATGVWTLSWLPSEPSAATADWVVRCEGISTSVGGVTQAAEGTVRVRASRVSGASLTP